MKEVKTQGFRVNTLILELGRQDQNYWFDLWRFRGLLYFLSWRDVLVRYKQTIIGLTWVLVRPILTTIVFVIVFHKLAGLPSNGVPYPIFVLSALLPWQFFSSSLVDSSNSLLSSAGMISKIYFPRLIIPISSIIVSVIDFTISLFLLFLLIAWYQVSITWHLLFLPLFFLMALLTSLGCGVYFSALNMKYRDFRFIVPFIAQFGLYISPVGFDSNLIPEKWRLIYSLNPMVGVIDGFRWAILGGNEALYLPGLFISLSVMSFILFFGIRYFRKTEKLFADLV